MPVWLERRKSVKAALIQTIMIHVMLGIVKEEEALNFITSSLEIVQ